jgi:stringent starvation protein B
MSAAEKRTKTVELLTGGVTQIHLDPRKAGIVLPEHLHGQHVVVLNLSWRFDGSEMDITDDVVSATLSFGGRPYRVTVPWGAVFAVSDKRTGSGQLWQDDAPPGVVALAAPPPKARPNHLRLVN